MKMLPMGWLVLDRDAGDLEGQVYRAVRERVLIGRLTAGDRLPSSRSFAASLDVARSTVVHAYERLQAEGFVEASTGSTTRIAVLPAPPQSARPHRPDGPLRPAEPHAVGSFQPGVPDLTSFPTRVWARCLAARARGLRVHDLGYQDASGLPELRAAILDHVSLTRGVSANVDQVLVMPSTGTAIDLLARLLVRSPDDIAWIEEPGYPAAQGLLRDAGARLVPVSCDARGLDVSTAVGPPPRLIYVTPSHQYPTGATLSLPRRLALLDLARSQGAVVIEDDYDSEFHYRAKPIAALQGIDRGNAVAYIGTFSKVLAPGVRVAYAILPPRLVAEAVAQQRLRGAVVPIHIQAALADFLREGHLRAHIRRMGALYAARMAATGTMLRSLCGNLLEVGGGEGGLQLAAWFRDPATDDRAATRALNVQGIAVRALSDFYLGPPRSGLLFGIARTTPEFAEASGPLIRRVLGGFTRRRGP